MPTTSFTRFPFVALVVFAMCGQLNAQTLTVTLAGTNYNGYGVSCFDARDGAISATVAGGTPPYEYYWSHGDSVPEVTGLAAGYYTVGVMDADSTKVSAEITLLQPNLIKLGLTPSLYPNEYNISCWNCFNGSIETTVTGGVGPYGYLWNDLVTTAERTGLGSRTGYRVEVTDANGCKTTSEALLLTQPDRNDWAMGGNNGTDPDVHFLGTSDSADFVLKSGGAEILRLTGQGDVKLLGPAQDIGPVFRMEDGTLRGGGGDWPLAPECLDRLGYYPFWKTKGNAFAQLCPDVTPLLGTLGNRPLIIVTNGVERMRIATNGKVGVGVESPQDQLEIHTDMASGGITLVNKRTDDNAHTEIRFKKNNDERWALGCDIAGNGGQDFFIWDALATTKRLAINAQGKVGIGTEPPLNGSIYKLYVADGIATRDVKVTAATNWPDYVFADGYSLMPLPELRAYLTEYRHMPGIPSATEVEEQDGVELGDMQVRLLKALEEQALYILQLEERINALEARRN